MNGWCAFDDNNRQTRHDGRPLSYDANGNLLSDGQRTYHWNARNQLVAIKVGDSVQASFQYDALGRRISKTEGGQTITYLYDGMDIVQERQGNTVNHILTGPGIDQRFARNEGRQRTYFLTDALGSTRALTNAAGEVIQRYDYTPYGQTQILNGSTTNPYQYTGRERDASGIYYYRARYYSPGMGRFISEDPIGLGGGANVYSYVSGKPISAVDPLGLAEWTVGIFKISAGKTPWLGGSAARFQAYSACKDGRYAFAEGFIYSYASGFGSPSFSGTQAKMHDDYDHADLRSLEGRFISLGGSVLFGAGPEYSSIIMGNARSNFEWSLNGGVGFGVAAEFGFTQITNSSSGMCGCGEAP